MDPRKRVQYKIPVRELSGHIIDTDKEMKCAPRS